MMKYYATNMHQVADIIPHFLLHIGPRDIFVQIKSGIRAQRHMKSQFSQLRSCLTNYHGSMTSL